MRALLEAGGNLLMFPEGIQNIRPGALLEHFYAGAIDLAITCNAEIIPIAISREGNRYYFFWEKTSLMRIVIMRTVFG